MDPSSLKRILIFIVFYLALTVQSFSQNKAGLYFLERGGAEVELKDRGSNEGVAIADFDNDGFLDVFFAFHGKELFQNQKDGTFKKVDLPTPTSYDDHGIAWIDINEDGWLDAFVSSGGNRGNTAASANPNYVFLNQKGTFKIHDLEEPLADSLGAGRSISYFDINKDGINDLLLQNFSREGRESRFLVSEGEEFTEIGDKNQWKDVKSVFATIVLLDSTNQPYLIGHRSGSSNGSSIYRINQDHSLIKVNNQLNIPDINFTERVIPFDYDADGDQDLYFVRGSLGVAIKKVGTIDSTLLFSTPGKQNEIQGFRARVTGDFDFEVMCSNQLVNNVVRLGKNQKLMESSQFRLSMDDEALKGEPQFNDGITPGVYLWVDDNQNLVYWFVSEGSSSLKLADSKGRIIGLQDSVSLVALEGLSNSGPKVHFENFLLRNDGQSFTDVTREAGLFNDSWGSDAAIADFDNDGDMDIYLVNGANLEKNPSNVFYENQGNGTFMEVTTELALEGPVKGYGQSAAAADFNNDGKIDIILVNKGSSLQTDAFGSTIFYQNASSTGNWVKIIPKSKTGSYCAMGTRVSVDLNGKVLEQQLYSSNGRFTTSITPFHFGIGTEQKIDVTIIWPSGKKSKHSFLANSTNEVSEPK